MTTTLDSVLRLAAPAGRLGVSRGAASGVVPADVVDAVRAHLDAAAG